MVDRLEALGGEVLDEVLTAQTGQETVWGENQGCLDCHQTTATKLKVGLKYTNLFDTDEKCSCV